MQGAALHPATGQLWASEHGPMGGDELNLPAPGANYGWPLATHGLDYSGDPVPGAVGPEAPGMVPPHHVWQVSPGLSGMAFYDGALFPRWQGDLFLGALASRELIRLELDGDRVLGAERLLGTLAAQFKVSARFRPALEAVLRAWIDAIVLRSAGDATEVLRRLIARGGPASARLIAAEAPAVENQPAPPAPEGLTPLADHLEVAEAFAPAAGALLKRVFLAETLEQVPSPLPRGITVVTLAGTVIHANGFCGHWMPEGQ